MTPLTLTLPGLPPSVNHMYLTTRTGQRIRTQAAKAWEAATVLTIAAARPEGWPTPLPRKQRYTLAIAYSLPTWRQDIGNLGKALEDAIARALGLDDRYCVAMQIERTSGLPATAITVRLLADLPVVRRKS